MSVKSDLETFCLQKAMSWGYDYFVSMDIDEYLMPAGASRGKTAVDVLHSIFEKGGSNLLRLVKFNFQQAPHSLEPVNLLTIEAYQSRMESPMSMTYFKRTTRKLAIQLNGHSVVLSSLLIITLMINC